MFAPPPTSPPAIQAPPVIDPGAVSSDPRLQWTTNLGTPFVMPEAPEIPADGKRDLVAFCAGIRFVLQQEHPTWDWDRNGLNYTATVTIRIRNGVLTCHHDGSVTQSGEDTKVETLP